MEKRGVYKVLIRAIQSHTRQSPAKRAQVAVEFMVLMAFILIILMGIIALNQGMLDSFTGQFRGEKARIVVSDLADAAESVYLQGVGAQTKVLISVPGGVAFSQVSNNTLRMSLSDRTGHNSDAYRNTKFVVNGFIPTEEGEHWVTVRAMPGYVLIGYGLLEVSPSGIARVLAPSNSSIDTISMRNVAGEDVDVAIEIELDEGIDAYLSASLFHLSDNENVTTDLTISVPSDTVPGLYTGRLIIQANTSTESQVLFLPLTVSVTYGSCQIGCPMIQLFPKLWDIGITGYNKLYRGMFFVCSNFNSTQIVSLNFSSSYLVGFNPASNQNTSSVTVSPNNCTVTYVYVNTSGGIEGDYSPLLLATASGASDYSQILFQLNFSGDQEPPIVKLRWPPDNYIVNSTNLLFKYNVTDLNSSIAYCSLIIDGSVVAINTTIVENAEQSFWYSWLSAGEHNWTVGCVDDSPYANYGEAEPRQLSVDTTIICVSPSIMFEEDYDPQWITEVRYEGDSSYAIAYDEGSGLFHLDYPPPDYVQMDFPSMGIDTLYAVSNAILYIKHKDFPIGGWFDVDDRHQVECYNGKNWVVMETYPNETSWAMYESSDISTCISTAEIANDIHLKFTYDPADTIGGYQYIDLVKVCVNVTEGVYVFLWPMAVDNQRIVDFTSGLNTTANTWGLAGSWGDGWDWERNIYGGDEIDVSVFNVDPNGDGNSGDSIVGTDRYLEVKVGGRPGGSENNPQDVKIIGPVASAGYGVMFNLTPELFNMINLSGKKAYVSFDWRVNENPWGEDRTLDDSDEGWIKARLTTQYETIWLGYDLDYGYADADPYNEIWFAYDPYDAQGHAYFDITEYLSYTGYYYLDFGIAVGDWDNEKEGLGGQFDNMAVIIK